MRRSMVMFSCTLESTEPEDPPFGWNEDGSRDEDECPETNIPDPD